MRNIALKLMYVGTAYHGWQIQKNAITVQEALELGISKVVKHPVRCVGAGRTDAGVHAHIHKLVSYFPYFFGKSALHLRHCSRKPSIRLCLYNIYKSFCL